jgi:GTP-binding protein EngB required for normal cell division
MNLAIEHDIPSTRALTTQLADDLSWLEEHCRSRPEQAVPLRLAAALVRNCIGPFLDGQPAPPLHVAVLGGAGAGKSTVANLLSGSTAAEANPQAGFTRHPVAYTSGNGPTTWAGHLGFLGPLQRLPETNAASLDADVYQVRRVSADTKSFDLLREFIVWDCPDMTTWAASGYVPRLVEVAALADLLVYVASDERYNDEVPTQFLRLLLQTGKPVVVCLTKMRESEAPALLSHFQKEVVSRMPPGIVATLPIPFLTPAELADPVNRAARFRIPLLNQVAVLGSPAANARRRSVYGAIRYLVAAHDQLMAAARQDVAALQSWEEVVQAGHAEFNERYRREYLASEKFRRFDEALVRLLDLLELPGIGKILSGALWVLRAPYRLLRAWIGRAMTRPDAPAMPEQPVLEQALTGWLDLLRKEAVRRADTHPVWAHIAHGFTAGGLAEQARERFGQGFRGFQLGQADEVDRTARAIYEEVEKNPGLLNTMRGGKFALDAAAVTAAAVTAGHSLLLDVILVPLAASVSQQLVEFLGQQYVEGQREEARQRQMGLMNLHISGPLAQWLTQWPATGGSAYERLRLALNRIPPALSQLDAEVTRKLTG